jgi:hypothetical protein
MKTLPKKAVDLTLPRWPPRTKTEAQALEDWTNAKLDEEHAILDRFIHLGDGFLPEGLPTREWAMEVYFETGDKSLIELIEPKLAKHLPQIKPSGKRGGGRIPNERHGDPIWQAVGDVKAIKQLWQKHFGKFYRPSKTSFGVTAESIAKKRYDIEEGKRRRSDVSSEAEEIISL